MRSRRVTQRSNLSLMCAPCAMATFFQRERYILCQRERRVAAHSLRARRREADALFGAAADRLEALARELGLVRALVVLDDLGLEQRKLAAAGPRAAFDAVSAAVDAEPAAARRSSLLLGLLGAEGPTVYAAAKKFNEGIDHAWVFRYEIDE